MSSFQKESFAYAAFMKQSNQNDDRHRTSRWYEHPQPAKDCDSHKIPSSEFYQNQPQPNTTATKSLIPEPNREPIEVSMRFADILDQSIHAATSFEELNLKQELIQGVYAMGFSKPSKIQERILPLMLSQPVKNLICQSQSGSGKTAAFVLAILQRVDPTLNETQAICVAPTRELSRQLVSVTEQMGRFLKVKTGLVIKDAAIKRHPIHEHIVIGTPGSILDSLRRGHIQTKNLCVFVLDEADNMLEKDGLGDQNIRIKKLVKNVATQYFLFSATFPQRVVKYAQEFAPDAHQILVSVSDLNVEGISQLYMDCNDQDHKYDVLCNLYELLTVSQSIIFCRTRHTAAQISNRMTSQGHRVQYLHAGLLPDERDSIIDRFRRGEFKVLISTNVVSRGIDICQVSLVVNYDMPLTMSREPDAEAYLHRIGRTGRFGRKGLSVCFVHDYRTLQEIQYIEDFFHIKMEKIETDDWEEVARRLKAAS